MLIVHIGTADKSQKFVAVHGCLFSVKRANPQRIVTKFWSYTAFWVLSAHCFDFAARRLCSQTHIFQQAAGLSTKGFDVATVCYLPGAKQQS